MTQGASFIIFLFAEGVQCPLTLMMCPYDNGVGKQIAGSKG